MPSEAKAHDRTSVSKVIKIFDKHRVGLWLSMALYSNRWISCGFVGLGKTAIRETHHRPKRRRRGYVLLLVLAIAVLLTTVLATLAKTSLRRALNAADAQRRLQLRWGTHTIQTIVLDRAPKVFEKYDEEHAKVDPPLPPPVTLRDALTLGSVTFDMVLGDEDAKLNLNNIYRLGGQERTQEVVSEVIGPEMSAMLRLLPAAEPDTAKGPLTSRASQDGQSRRAMQASGGTSGDETLDEGDVAPIPDAFRSWGEVFDVSAISAQIGNDAALPNLTSQITCWGGGQSNLRRASDETIQATIASVLPRSQAKQLLSRYRDNPAMSPQTLFQGQISEESPRDQLSRMFTQSSNNYSLWIDASTVGRRSMRRFIVMQRDESGMTTFHQFAH